MNTLNGPHLDLDLQVLDLGRVLHLHVGQPGGGHLCCTLSFCLPGLRPVHRNCQRQVGFGALDRGGGGRPLDGRSGCCQAVGRGGGGRGGLGNLGQGLSQSRPGGGGECRLRRGRGRWSVLPWGGGLPLGGPCGGRMVGLRLGRWAAGGRGGGRDGRGCRLARGGGGGSGAGKLHEGWAGGGCCPRGLRGPGDLHEGLEHTVGRRCLLGLSPV